MHNICETIIASPRVKESLQLLPIDTTSVWYTPMNMAYTHMFPVGARIVHTIAGRATEINRGTTVAKWSLESLVHIVSDLGLLCAS
jgi:hypothetical protein